MYQVLTFHISIHIQKKKSEKVVDRSKEETSVCYNC